MGANVGRGSDKATALLTELTAKFIAMGHSRPEAARLALLQMMRGHKPTALSPDDGTAREDGIVVRVPLVAPEDYVRGDEQ